MTVGRLLIAAAALTIVLVLTSLLDESKSTQREAEEMSIPVVVTETREPKPIAHVEMAPPSPVRPEILPPSKDLSILYTELPRNSDRKARPDHHGISQPALIAAAHFGHVLDEVHANPERAPSAARFFRRCAEDRELLAPLRSLCLEDWKLVRENNEAAPDVEPEVESLSSPVPVVAE